MELNKESDNSPEDTSRTDGGRREPKHLGLSSSKPDIRSFLGCMTKWQEAQMGLTNWYQSMRIGKQT